MKAERGVEKVFQKESWRERKRTTVVILGAVSAHWTNSKRSPPGGRSGDGRAGETSEKARGRLTGQIGMPTEKMERARAHNQRVAESMRERKRSCTRGTEGEKAPANWKHSRWAVTHKGREKGEVGAKRKNHQKNKYG